MKITLIFSPFVTPSYIPLGIAQLKSYIEKQIPSVKIFNFDLNNQLFNNLMRKDFLEKFINMCDICPGRCKRNKGQKERFLNHAKVFRIGVNYLKDNKTGAFYNVQKYNYLMLKINSFWSICEKCLNSIAKEIIEKGISVPPVFEDLFEDDMKIIFRKHPKFVGFSLFCRNQLPCSLVLAKIIKKRINIPIIFGGAFTNYIDIQNLLSSLDFVDFVIDKEGEIGISEFTKNFIKKDFPNVPGLHYRQAGKTFSNKEQFIKNLDDLPPPDFSDFKLERYLLPSPVLPVTFSRGCYWRKCTYCSYHRHYPAAYKTKSIKKFILEIKYYNSFGIKHFFIDDDVISASNLNEISKELKKKKIKIFFGALVRPENNFSYSVLKNIYSAGGRVLLWGVESSCQRVLDLMKKGTKINAVKSILADSNNIGFHNHLFMIQGFPTQTGEEICKDIRFLQANQNSIQSFRIHPFILYEGSYIFNNLEEFKISSIRALPVYKCKRNKPIVSDWQFTFKREIALRRREISARVAKEFELLKKRHNQKYIAFEYSQMLLHASQDLKNNNLKHPIL